MKYKKILFIALKYYDADLDKGFSYEYCNFYKNLKKYFSVDFLAIDEIIQKKGYGYLNSLILEKSEKYNFLFFFMYKDDFNLKTLLKIKHNKNVKSIAWMSDDHWRYDIYGKKYIGYFDLVVTTCEDSFKKYKKFGQKTFLGFWATDGKGYNKNNKFKYAISFVGKKYGSREKYIKYLQYKKFPIKCFGLGWGKNSFFSGNIRKIFSQSLINLNFSESSTGLTLRNVFKVFFHKKTNGYYYFNNPLKYFLYFKTFCLNNSNQIKGRVFEIISTKSFLLTEYHKDLSKFFKIGEEIDCFHNKKDLLQKISYYSKNINKVNLMSQKAYTKFIKSYKIKILFKTMLNFAEK